MKYRLIYIVLLLCLLCGCGGQNAASEEALPSFSAQPIVLPEEISGVLSVSQLDADRVMLLTEVKNETKLYHADLSHSVYTPLTVPEFSSHRLLMTAACPEDQQVWCLSTNEHTNYLWLLDTNGAVQNSIKLPTRAETYTVQSMICEPSGVWLYWVSTDQGQFHDAGLWYYSSAGIMVFEISELDETGTIALYQDPYGNEPVYLDESRYLYTINRLKGTLMERADWRELTDGMFSGRSVFLYGEEDTGSYNYPLYGYHNNILYGTVNGGYNPIADLQESGLPKDAVLDVLIPWGKNQFLVLTGSDLYYLTAVGDTSNVSNLKHATYSGYKAAMML